MLREFSLVGGAITTCAGTGLSLLAFGAGVLWAMIGSQPFYRPEALFIFGLGLAVVGIVLIEYGRGDL